MSNSPFAAQELALAKFEAVLNFFLNDNMLDAANIVNTMDEFETVYALSQTEGRGAKGYFNCATELTAFILNPVSAVESVQERTIEAQAKVEALYTTFAEGTRLASQHIVNSLSVFEHAFLTHFNATTPTFQTRYIESFVVRVQAGETF